jgi:hypothetical protein
MNMDAVTFFSKLADNALTLGALAVAVWWLQKTLAQFIGRWDQERGARLDSMEKELDRQRQEMAHLRVVNEDCQKDRVDIHKELVALYRNNPSLNRKPE